MKKDNKLVVVTVLIAVLLAAVAVSQATVPSSKAAVGGTEVVISYDPQDAGIENETLAEVQLKTTKKKDLIVSVSAECALMTDTKVKARDILPIDRDLASIEVWIEITPEDSLLLDGAYEGIMGPVTFAERVQIMEGTLSDMTYVCKEIEGEVICDWEDYPEEVNLTLKTTSANTFNFYILNLEPGVHTITAKAKLTTENDSPIESPNIMAAVGDRTIIVQEVRLVND